MSSTRSVRDRASLLSPFVMSMSAASAAPAKTTIDIVFPDIARWSKGNRGVPYVWTFDSGLAGPHVAIQALTHGNEVCGAIAADFLLQHAVRPRRGLLSICFANHAAFGTFNRDEPFKSRFIDEDFNRVWAASALDSERTSAELVRARELREFYDTVDFLLDIHSMSDPCPPLMLAGTRRKGVELARALGYPEYVVIDPGHSAGRRLRDYGRFDDPDDPRTALLVECGQHWSEGSPRVAVQCALRFLQHFDAADPAFIARHLDRSIAPRQAFIEVTESIPVRSDDFRFVWPAAAGLAVVPSAGSLIARDGDVEIRTPYERCVLIMPMRRRAKAGDTAVRLGRFVD